LAKKAAASAGSRSSSAARRSTNGRRADPPGLGNFLIKVGSRPGIPLHVDLTTAELEVNNTNKRWNK